MIMLTRPTLRSPSIVIKDNSEKLNSCLKMRPMQNAQGDIADALHAVRNMQTINGGYITAKHKLESSIHTSQAEVDGAPEMQRKNLRKQ